MATLRVTSLRGRTSGTSPTLPDGAVVTGVTTSTIALVDVVTQVTIAPSGNVGDALPVLPLKFVTLSVAIRDLRFEGHQ